MTCYFWFFALYLQFLQSAPPTSTLVLCVHFFQADALSGQKQAITQPEMAGPEEFVGQGPQPGNIPTVSPDEMDGNCLPLCNQGQMSGDCIEL